MFLFFVLSTHLTRIGISDTCLCECRQSDQTPDHVLQSFPKLDRETSANMAAWYWSGDQTVGLGRRPLPDGWCCGTNRIEDLTYTAVDHWRRSDPSAQGRSWIMENCRVRPGYVVSSRIGLFVCTLIRYLGFKGIFFTLLIWMSQHDCLDTYCFQCLICMCVVFLYLHLFSATEPVAHGKAL